MAKSEEYQCFSIRQLKQTAMNSHTHCCKFGYSLPLALANGLKKRTFWGFSPNLFLFVL
jgi:hypothetical protein